MSLCNVCNGTFKLHYESSFFQHIRAARGCICRFPSFSAYIKMLIVNGCCTDAQERWMNVCNLIVIMIRVIKRLHALVSSGFWVWARPSDWKTCGIVVRNESDMWCEYNDRVGLLKIRVVSIRQNLLPLCWKQTAMAHKQRATIKALLDIYHLDTRPRIW